MSTKQFRPGCRSGRAGKHSQNGVVLFISLIVLVAMSLAGIALMRSVDTTVMVSGNIALKQSAILGADQGTQAAVVWLEANNNGATLQGNNSSASYFAALSLDPVDWFVDSTWANAIAINGGAPDAAGNTIMYIIHRQCTLAGSYDAAGNQCSAIDQSVGGSVLTEGDSFKAGVTTAFARAKQVYYRITTRVKGPRNGQSVIQTTVSLQA